jgi:hypothetical protein
MRLILIASVLALFGACSSGGGCGGDDAKSSSSSGDSGGGGGGGGSSRGGTGESVSFQGLGKNPAPPPANGQKQAVPGTNVAAAALGGSAATSPPQSVICGGFPGLPPDCLKDPVFDAIKKKCCPTGQVDACHGIPGGARLTGRACTAVVK